MARTTYLAPGVYVEEVPSAAQPIAGVGTNTVGFIGVIEKDYVYCPVPNETYDPVSAQAALIWSKSQGKSDSDAAAKAARTTLETRIEALKNEIKKFDEDTIPKAEQKVKDVKEGTDAEKNRADVALTRARDLRKN